MERLNPGVSFTQVQYLPFHVEREKKAVTRRWAILVTGFLAVAAIQYWFLPTGFAFAARVARLFQPRTAPPHMQPLNAFRIVTAPDKWSVSIRPPAESKSMRVLTKSGAKVRIALNGREIQGALQSFCSGCSYQFRSASQKPVEVLVEFYRTPPR